MPDTVVPLSNTDISCRTLGTGTGTGTGSEIKIINNTGGGLPALGNRGDHQV